MTTDDPGAQQDVPQSPGLSSLVSPTVFCVRITYGHTNRNRTDDLEGEFDSAADALWANYGREAKSRDKDKFNAIKDDMNSVFLFVRSYLLLP